MKSAVSICVGIAIALASASTVRARPCSYLGEYPCAYKSKCIENLKDSADWVLDGNIASVEGTGKQTECEHVPMFDGSRPCSQVDSAEKIKLSDVRVIRGDFQVEEGKIATISRKDICFSGPLAEVMNRRPELEMRGQRVRFYGDNRDTPPFLTKGFYYIEPTH